MNPLRVWILQIHDPFLNFSKEMQNPFLDLRIRIWIFAKKRTLRLITQKIPPSYENQAIMNLQDKILAINSPLYENLLAQKFNMILKFRIDFQLISPL